MVSKLRAKYQILVFSVVVVVVFLILSSKWSILTKNWIQKSHFDRYIPFNDRKGKLFLYQNGAKRQPCPKTTPRLRGTRTAQLMRTKESDVPEFNEIAEANRNLTSGGHYSPEHCTPWHKTAIIIPYRQREFQLRGLLSHMHPIWQRQELDYTVYVITQAGNDMFNRAKLLNAGFVEASNEDDYNCFVFHDVDILLENDKCSYHCSDDTTKVKHLSAYLDKYDYKLRRYPAKCPPPEYDMAEIINFGGITMMSARQFREVNGFSNLYWGWGGEDDEMSLRVWKKGFSVVRDEVCRYSMYKHDRADANFLKKRILNSCFKRMDSDGVNSLTYKVLSKHRNPVYINITVDIGSPSGTMLAMIHNKYERRSCDGDAFLNRKNIW